LTWALADPDDSHGTGCGDQVRGQMNPGTYYNVRVKTAGAFGTTTSFNGGAGAELMVVVDGAGSIAEVQVTSGGNGLYKAGNLLRFADTRLKSDMAFSAAGDHQCIFEVGDMSTSDTMSSPLKSVASGISSSDSCVTMVDTGTTDACGTGNADTKFHNVPTSNDQLDGTTDANAKNHVRGMRVSLECGTGGSLSKVTVTFGGLVGLHALSGTANDDNAEQKIMVDSSGGGVSVDTECTNGYYYQFGFYNSMTPRWARDVAQNNYDMGKVPKDEQVALYGMKNHVQYQFEHNSANHAVENFYGLGRDTFSDLNAGMDATMAGYSVTDSDNDGGPQITASVIAGENGHDSAHASAPAFGTFMEHAEKYAYIGRGYDKLTVTPLPDAMTNQKVIIEYTGPSAGCAVAEVDRGTHESAECSGRGNCDHATGTCVCDAGYTLEACSEQTVLV